MAETKVISLRIEKPIYAAMEKDAIEKGETPAVYIRDQVTFLYAVRSHIDDLRDHTNKPLQDLSEKELIQYLADMQTLIERLKRDRTKMGEFIKLFDTAIAGIEKSFLAIKELGFIQEGVLDVLKDSKT